MKKLNSSELFEIFSQGDEQVYADNGVEDILDSSFILFGMVIRGVENYFIINKIYSNRYGEHYELISDSIKLKYFNGLIGYLHRIDITQSDTLEQLRDEFGPQAIKYALEELLEFYEQRELYEQCAIIFKFINIFFEK